MEPFTLSMPMISVNHLDQATQDRLAAGDSPWCACAVLPGAGFFLYLDELYAGDEAIPQCLQDVRQWLSDWSARQTPKVKDCWIRLDRDADPVEGLPVYGDEADQGPADGDTHVLFDRRFDVLARFPETRKGILQANQYMEANPLAAVLEVKSGTIILASKTDRGVPV